MQYKVIKNADKIVKGSSYLIKDPFKYQKKWNDLFGNNNPIHLELGMGRGDFIIDMAKSYPNINFIGLEIVDSQMVMAVNKLINLKLPNLKLINIDAKEIGNIFLKEITYKIMVKYSKKEKEEKNKSKNKKSNTIDIDDLVKTQVENIQYIFKNLQRLS